MPLRRDPSLWFNLPGVVAAYQPVRAPDSLSARYNMAHGGDSRYRAEPGVLPAWTSATGWNVSSVSMYMDTGIVVNNSMSGIVRFAESAETGYPVFGAEQSGQVRFNIFNRYNGGAYYFRAGGNYNATGGYISGVLAVTPVAAYANGVALGLLTGAYTGTTSLTITFAKNNGNSSSGWTGKIQCAVFVNRTLTPADVWYASRQMQYCDANPDWSVWSPRRKWYFYTTPVVAGRAGIYGARPTVALPGGVRIVPQDEGGVIDG